MADFNNGITQLQEEQGKSLQNCEAMIEKWKKFKEDYENVDKLLSDLPKKTTHDVMVPIGPLAFMPGQLIHTNEIMVLLGDNWFAERSATQAMEIAQRRLKSVDDYLSNLRKEHENILSHMSFTKDVINTRDKNYFQEIKEELTDKDRQRQDKKSRVAHAKAMKHSVKKVNLTDDSSGSRTKSKEDDDLFARLEELERQEQMNNELENEEYFADSACNTNCDESTKRHDEITLNETQNSSRTKNASSHVRACSNKERAQLSCTVKEQNTSSRAKSCSFEDKRAANACTRSEQNDVSDTCSPTKATSSNDADKHLVKKVSWKQNIVEKQEEDGVVYPKHGNTIHFIHSTGTVSPKQEESHELRQSIASPADILPFYLKQTMEQHSESTSKGSTDGNSSTSKVPELKQAGVTQDKKGEKEKVPQAFSDVVLEHNDVPRITAGNEEHKEQKTERRRISKFKAGRMKND